MDHPSSHHSKALAIAAAHGHGEAPRTLGVEEELLLVDPRSGRIAPAIELVLAAAAAADVRALVPEAHDLTRLEREAKREQVEAISVPHTSLDTLERSVALGRALADVAARQIGLRAVAMGTSATVSQTQLTASKRYAAIAEQFQSTMREQLTCGLHVHVGVADDDEGVAVLDRIRPWLPLVLALSANSPMWGGEDSGYASQRYQVWSRWPTAGPTDIFGSPAAYHRAVDALLATGVPLDDGMVYFDARLSARFPTVEVRVADVCLEAAHSVAIAGIVRALVSTAAQEWKSGFSPDPMPTTVVRLAMWSASRHGVTGPLLNPILGQPCEPRVAIDALLAHIAPALAATNDLHRVTAMVDEVFASGSGAERQRRIMRERRSARALVTDAIERTHRPVSPTSPFLDALPI
ncbi:glutamate--cysteine ligase [Leucobacter musarum]|uniref:glutamate--cysteine ligase n=1 Tax=Leucobacter musarum TaxID=1930747 RepID=UPI0009E9AF76|nr:glutamate--cysteine ligase [Leucobacter musarum]